MSRGSIVWRGEKDDKGRPVKGKGNWAVVVDIGKDSGGKRKQLWRTVQGTKVDAGRVLTELLHSLDGGSFIRPVKETLGTFLDRWLRDYVWPNLSPRTAEGYEHIIKQHIVPALGNIPLSEIKPTHLQGYYADKLECGRKDGKGGLSARSVQHHHVTLHTALQSAVKWGLLARNPADAVDRPRYECKEMHTFDEESLRAFLLVAKATPYYSLFYVALFTGLRRSELLALRWDDIDLDMAQVSVSRALHHLRTGETLFRTTKTAKSRRLVDLPPSAAIVLRQHREQQEAVRESMGTGAMLGSDLVFTSLEGAPMLPDTFTHAWIKTARRAGFPNIRLHDARHTHATLLLKQGVHPKIVQERLGHATISTTLDTYSHVLPGLQQAAALKFDMVAQPQNEVENMVADLIR